MSLADPLAIDIADASQVAAGRLRAQRMARELAFDETRVGRVAIAVTEALTNLWRHGGGGTFTAQAIARSGALGIEVLAIDSGPGMTNFEASARDGVSTLVSAGNGLGAMRRLADEFDVYTQPGDGTVVRMAFWDQAMPPAAGAYESGSVCVPMAGESVSGDAWGFEEHAQGGTWLVADGLGHGPDASIASALAVECLHSHAAEPAIRILDAAHARLRATRGAAVGVMRHERATGEIAFAGVGNIAACLWEPGTRRAMVSHNGIVGVNVHRSMEYRYTWPRHALLVAHSDGLESRWELEGHAGLAACHPSVIAAVLYRGHSRKRDDVVVLVARRRS